ncbi:MAG: hypothetical protein GC184_03980 [Rhizobiales bacterium]|nr:hypothetical protein [Hyphomicrobiales bacterium]
MVSESHTRSLQTRFRGVAPAAFLLLSLGLAGCDTIGTPGTPLQAEPILVQDAEKRVSLAQESLDRANKMIADGEQQTIEGKKLIADGEQRISVGQTLKAEAERQLGIAQSEAAEARARAGMIPQEGDAPVPQTRPGPISVQPY